MRFESINEILSSPMDDDAEDQDRREKLLAESDRLARYGKYRWCVKTELEPAEGEIYLMADSMEVVASGALVFRCGKLEGFSGITLAIPSGEWSSAYAASCVDGSPVAVERWTGEKNGA